MTSIQLQKQFFNELYSFYTQNELAAIWKHCLEFILELNQVVFITNPEREIEDAKVFKLESTIQRLKNFEPIQYITGKTWFCDSIFNVNPSVLIPRPETEELVNLVCEHTGKGNANIIDIGTGSGCIAISIKRMKPQNVLVAVDISEEALNTARNNAVQILGDTSISFINRDVLKPDFADIFKTKFDVVVSNPPYIPMDKKSTISDNVLNFEPHLALFCDDDPLQFYKAIATHAKQLLKPDGLLFFEIHEDFGLELERMLVQNNFKETEIIKDIHGKNRIIKTKI